VCTLGRRSRVPDCPPPAAALPEGRTEELPASRVVAGWTKLTVLIDVVTAAMPVAPAFLFDPPPGGETVRLADLEIVSRALVQGEDSVARTSTCKVPYL